MIRNILFVGIGGAIGSMARYGTYLLTGNRSFPLGTFAVNIIGSFIIGIVLAAGLKNEAFAQNWKVFLAAGFCGGFTTFSAFTAENMQLLQNGKYMLCLVYIISSILLGITAAWLGFKIVN